MNANESTLKFELSTAQTDTLQSAPAIRNQSCGEPELSFRAWNASFVPCSDNYEVSLEKA